MTFWKLRCSTDHKNTYGRSTAIQISKAISACRQYLPESVRVKESSVDLQAKFCNCSNETLKNFLFGKSLSPFQCDDEEAVDKFWVFTLVKNMLTAIINRNYLWKITSRAYWMKRYLGIFPCVNFCHTICIQVFFNSKLKQLLSCRKKTEAGHGKLYQYK